MNYNNGHTPRIQRDQLSAPNGQANPVAIRAGLTVQVCFYYFFSAHTRYFFIFFLQ